MELLDNSRAIGSAVATYHALSHLFVLCALGKVVDLVKESGASVTFHVLDVASYKQAKTEGVDFSDPHPKPTMNGVAGEAPKPKLCYLTKSSGGYGFSLRSVKGQRGGAHTHTDVISLVIFLIVCDTADRTHSNYCHLCFAC